ncbi:hypothetical protein DTO96_102388 [Ephemeroptericola cinctiostellae]|uniref:Phage tail protein I n=1 Tax=Ephemeroptericola cinctiostellae TaxID=2268024 RepID=A0A345DE45_9BURK|nr:phage tail protein I [Ephemeroptericola cinctiostellae]AXF86633.1 hypothetical protein DTO96_102388 [Ephemeroptericola cinctiostellae]
MTTARDLLMRPERTLHTLLPSGSSTLEKAMVDAYDAQPLPRIIPTLYDADACPVELLEHLAYALNVDVWDTNWDEARKRAVLRTTENVQAHKGTPHAVVNMLAALGYPGAKLYERVCGRKIGDQSIIGSDPVKTRWFLGDEWATFGVELAYPLAPRMVSRVVSAINATKRASQHLVRIWYRSPLHIGQSWQVGDGHLINQDDLTLELS